MRLWPQGALLLVLFQVSHTVEHQLTDRAQGSLETLFDSIPESATLVELDKAGEPDMDRQRQVKAADVRIGQTMLVKPGEQVGVVLHNLALCHLPELPEYELAIKGRRLPCALAKRFWSRCASRHKFAPLLQRLAIADYMPLWLPDAAHPVQLLHSVLNLKAWLCMSS